MEDDDMTPICSVLVVVLLWYSFFRVAFLPPVNNNGALRPVERKRERERERESEVVIFP